MQNVCFLKIGGKLQGGMLHMYTMGMTAERAETLRKITARFPSSRE